jgi:pimeloyl-ACP methyl ester carboxylesterase
MTAVPLAKTLEQQFTVYTYDRRGRGDSTDTPPYAVEREIEDLDAIIQAAGGSAFVFGYSSGAVLAMRAAAHDLAIKKLALYDPPPTGPHAGELAARLADLVAAGCRGDAVELFQTEGVGIPTEVVIGLRNAPFRPALEKMAHTLVYEMTILNDETMPAKAASSVQMPTLIMVGGNNPEFLQQSGQLVAGAISGSQLRTLDGQTHDINPEVMAPVMKAFLAN